MDTAVYIKHNTVMFEFLIIQGEDYASVSIHSNNH